MLHRTRCLFGQTSLLVSLQELLVLLQPPQPVYSLLCCAYSIPGAPLYYYCCTHQNRSSLQFAVCTLLLLCVLDARPEKAASLPDAPAYFTAHAPSPIYYVSLVLSPFRVLALSLLPFFFCPTYSTADVFCPICVYSIPDVAIYYYCCNHQNRSFLRCTVCTLLSRRNPRSRRVCAAPELDQAARRRDMCLRSNRLVVVQGLLSEEYMKKWRSRPLLVIGPVQQDRMRRRRRRGEKWREMDECACVHGRSITELSGLNTPSGENLNSKVKPRLNSKRYFRVLPHVNPR